MDGSRPAEAARETAVAVEAAVIVVRETADIARESVDVTRDWFELSPRPFISLGGWEIVARDSGRVVIRGRLSDVAGVPTTIENVCIWSGPQQVVESQRNFVQVNLDDNAIAFMDHHQWVLYGPLPLRTQVVGQRIGFLSTIYSFSREGTSSSETWRVDSEVLVAEESRLLIRTIDMYRVEEVTC